MEDRRALDDAEADRGEHDRGMRSMRLITAAERGEQQRRIEDEPDALPEADAQEDGGERSTDARPHTTL